MEEVAEDLNVECLAEAIVGDEIVLIARAGTLRSTVMNTNVGTRIPFKPPLGAAFVAWAPAAAARTWLDRAGKNADPETRRVLERTLAAVRAEGYAVGRGWLAQRPVHLLPDDYPSPYVNPEEVNSVSVPVFDGKGSVALVLTVTVAGHRSLSSEIARTVARLQAAASSVSKAALRI
jgi:DNA-binding IclR family transcriptional regulator